MSNAVREALAAAVAEMKRANDLMLREVGIGVIDLNAIERAEAALSSPEQEAEPAGGGMCMPNGLGFDAFGEPRVRYVRITLDGAHLIQTPAEADAYLRDAKAGGDESDYVVSDVWLSEREAEDLPEFDGF